MIIIDIITTYVGYDTEGAIEPPRVLLSTPTTMVSITQSVQGFTVGTSHTYRHGRPLAATQCDAYVRTYVRPIMTIWFLPYSLSSTHTSNSAHPRIVYALS